MFSGFKIISIDNFFNRELRRDFLFHDKIYLDRNEFLVLHEGDFNYDYRDSFRLIFNEIEQLIDAGVVEIIDTFSLLRTKKSDEVIELINEYTGLGREVSDYANLTLNQGNCARRSLRMRSSNPRHRGDIEFATPFDYEPGDFSRDEMIFAQDISTRVLSLILSQEIDRRIHPILNKSINNIYNSKISNPNFALRVILNNYPLINFDVPVKELIDFKMDSEVKYRFKIFKELLYQLANSNLYGDEIEDRIDYLLGEYQRQLKIYGLKYSYSRLESIVIPSMEIIENIMKFNWSKVAQGLFSISKSKVEFLRDELSFKGRDVAYLHFLKDYSNE